MSELPQLRAELDAIDEELVDILVRRFRVTQAVGRYKKAHGLPAVDEDREREKLEQVTSLAERMGLDTQLAQDVMRLIIDRVVTEHEAVMEENPTETDPAIWGPPIPEVP